MKSYIIKRYLDNVGVDKNHPAINSFDVHVEYKDKTKWLSIPHDLYFSWAIRDSEKLEKYLENHKFLNWEEVITDLNSLEYNWTKELTRYIDKFYPKRLYDIVENYNPESFDEDKDFPFDRNDDDDDE